MAYKKLEIKKITSARINQERAGHSISTSERLKFQVAHALARDAVYAHWDVQQLKKQLEEQGNEVLILNTLTSSREEYLMKPHLGRCLNQSSLDILKENLNEYDLVFCVSDGLSALAIHSHFLNFWKLFKPKIEKYKYKIAPIILVPFGRVAVENQIGELLNAKEVIIFIGERPGLSSHDSMGVYLTYSPHVTTKDSESNCISNIHPPNGLHFKNACQNLLYLISESIQRHYSGVNLKIEEDKMLTSHQSGTQKYVK